MTEPRTDRTSQPSHRQKRRQVSRACDECRTYRIKCDSGNPCANCRRKGRQCSNGDADRVTSLAIAEQKITELRSQIKALQSDLQHARNWTAQPLPTPESLPATDSLDVKQTDKKLYNHGVSLRAPRSSSESFLGPSSLYYFATRLVRPLSIANTNSATEPSPSADSLIPRHKSYEAPLSEELLGDNGSAGQTAATNEKLSDPLPGAWSPMQEQYFTDRYWNSVHTSTLPILDEAEFKTYHQSLWPVGGGPREPSALVDTVIALCMQLGVPAVYKAGAVGSREAEVDMTLAGQRYYRRAQALLSYEMEHPTLATLQCYLLGALYACAGSFHNKVDIIVATAVRTAYILGLHVEPSASLSRKEQEKRRRLWWATFLLETKISMKLGRPFGIDDSYSMPGLPSDDAEAAVLAGSMFAPIGPQETWLSFNKYHITLYKTVREIYSAFFGTCATLSPDQNIWKSPELLEVCAESLQANVKLLNEWRESVPDSLRTRRLDGGVALSVDGSALDVEAFAPVWLQRQCLLLELVYHHHSTNLFRPLIFFGTAPKFDSTASQLANRCALHAIAYTKILYQVLTTMQMLEGWNEAFHWQWNAVVTLLGFVLAYSNDASSQVAADSRKAIDLAIQNCEIYAKSFSVATKAAQSIRELMRNIDRMLSLRSDNPEVDGQTGFEDQTTPGPSFLDPCIAGVSDEMAGQEQIYDMVMGIDFWHDLDVWWPNLDAQMAGGPASEAFQTYQG